MKAYLKLKTLKEAVKTVDFAVLMVPKYAQIYENDFDIDDLDLDDFDIDKYQKQVMVFNLCQNDPKLQLEINPEALSRPLLNLDKSEIATYMGVLDSEFLIPMLDELPRELLDVVASQIDPADFAELIVKEFPEILFLYNLSPLMVLLRGYFLFYQLLKQQYRHQYQLLSKFLQYRQV